LIVKTLEQPKDKRTRNYLLIAGVGQSVLFVLIGTIIFAKSAIAQNIIPISTLLMIAMISIGILKFSLFDLRAVIARAAAYVVTLIVIVGVFIGIFTAIFSTFTGSSFTKQQEILLGLFMASSVLLFQPIKKIFNKISNSIFYRDAYDAQGLLNMINADIVNTTDIYKLLENITRVIEENLKVEFCNFYIDERAAIDFHTVGTNTSIFGKSIWFKLGSTISKNEEKIIINNSENKNKTLVDLMQSLNIDLLVKMSSQDQNVGYIVVGSKRSGSILTVTDLQIMEIIADEVAIAVQNTLRFEEIAQFNVTLQKKIELATAELKKTNEKLKALDEAKDEFISMASHQLRTPLTSVKGYISMLLEGDAGKVDRQQKNFLNQAYLSSQRMVYLISDLLNVSRLKTGKFVIESKPTYLPDVVEGELSQLTVTAKSRGLEIVFDKPKEFPILNLDETKTRQVIMNFADNAIYYTPKGGRITVKLQATKDTVEFTVNDTGIGVPQSEQHHLFTKFYRAGNARKARPDGTGLGLFMAKKVVMAEGGAIIFKTVESKGSTFGFSFPREKLEITPDKSRALQKNAA